MGFTAKRDVLTANGPDTQVYLHGQISQNVDDMVDGESRLSFLLEPKGNVESCFRITRLERDHYLLDTETGHGPLLCSSLERFKLRFALGVVHLLETGIVGGDRPDVPGPLDIVLAAHGIDTGAFAAEVAGH